MEPVTKPKKQTIQDLIKICKAQNIKGYSGLSKSEIQTLIDTTSKPKVEQPENKVEKDKTTVHRLNYIGSKYQLLDWITTHIITATGKTDFQNTKVADLFAGTGIVSHHFRTLGASVQSNDAELYSAVITHAFTCSTYTTLCETLINALNAELGQGKTFNGFITDKYSPKGPSHRKFFTIENAQKIDYLRTRIETLKPSLTEDEHKFLLASLLLSADAVSNVPAVYGCFLQNFKTKATRPLILKPVHNNKVPAKHGSATFHADVLALPTHLQKTDIVYLDPPYNGRQYSKNYFPLNMLALTPQEQALVPPLKGKTGIPDSCFISPFCKKGDAVTAAFESLFKDLKTDWIFLSYNSESTVKKQDMLDLMNKYGKASVVERDYKRFKSFDYNKDVAIKEYLFILKKA
jgi:adenine-specific DNA-methyltransferase